MSMADHPDQLLQVRMSPGTPEPGVETFFLCSSDKSCQILLFLFGLINHDCTFLLEFCNPLKPAGNFDRLILRLCFCLLCFCLTTRPTSSVLKTSLKASQVILLKKFQPTRCSC